MSPEAISEALKPLLGLRVNRSGRAADMLWIHFGELRESVSRLGERRLTGEWALHVQCAWRLCRAGQILVARSDFYYNSRGDALEDWATPGANAFDAAADRLAIEFANCPCFVSGISTDDVDGVRLDFSNGQRLEVFPNTSVGGIENWRLFRPGLDERHFVIESIAP